MFIPEEENKTQSQNATPQSAVAPSVDTYPFRLLDDEQVMGTYPVARVTRPFGSMASFIFVTDSRVIYGSEAKSFAGSSYQSREFSVESVQGVDVALKRGFDSRSLAFTLGIILNFLLVIFVLPNLLGGNFGLLSGLGFLVGPLIILNLVLAVVTVLVLRNPEVRIRLVGQFQPVELSESREDAKALLLRVLTILLLLLVPFLYALWLLGRELGIWTADDSSNFANPSDVDHLARELGAQIIDVKARGKMAARR